MKVTCREQVNRSEYGNKEAIYYEQENGIVTSDQSHKCKLLLVLILNKGINAMDEHMILQDKEYWHDCEKSIHRKLIEKVY